LSVCISHVTQIVNNARAHARTYTQHTHARTYTLVRETSGDVHCQFAGLLAPVSKQPAGPATDRPTGRPSQHRLVFLVFRYVQANVEMAAKIPSCHCMLLVQPTMFKFTKINPRALKLRKWNLLSKLDAETSKGLSKLRKSFTCVTKFVKQLTN